MQGVTETLLFTLYMRYRESTRPDAKLADRRYADLVNAIDFDFSIFDEIPEDMQLSIACRTLIFENLTRHFIDTHPESIIIGLGSGLDFRHERLDNGHAVWIDIDVPEVIALRNAFFPETARHYSIASSILDFSWMQKIPKGLPTLFIAEGLFVYFTPVEVKHILSNLSRAFRGSEMILDVYNNWYVNAAKESTPYSFLNKMYAMWKWGMDDWCEIEAVEPGIQFIEEYYQYHGFGERMPAGLKAVLSGEDGYSEREQAVILTMSRVGHIRL